MREGEPAGTLLQVSADVVEWLPDIVRETRKAAGMSLTGVETVTGVARATVRSVEMGAGCSTTTAVRLLRWAATA